MPTPNNNIVWEPIDNANLAIFAAYFDITDKIIIAQMPRTPQSLSHRAHQTVDEKSVVDLDGVESDGPCRNFKAFLLGV